MCPTFEVTMCTGLIRVVAKRCHSMLVYNIHDKVQDAYISTHIYTGSSSNICAN